MVTSGIMFKEQFDMSALDTIDLIQMYNPEDGFTEEISEGVLKTEIYKFPDEEIKNSDFIPMSYKIIGYEIENPEIYEHILQISKNIEYACPKIYRCEEVSPSLFITAIPFYDDCDIEDDEIAEGYSLLNDKIETVVKELSRVCLFFMKEFSGELIKYKLRDYAEFFFKFSEFIELDEKSLENLIKETNFEKKLEQFFKEIKDEDNKDQGKDSEIGGSEEET